MKRERKAAAVAVMSTNEDDPVDRIIRHYSSWYRLEKCIAWILSYRQKLFHARLSRKEGATKLLVIEKTELISLEGMKFAERETLKYVQQRSFKERMSCLLSERRNDEELS